LGVELLTDLELAVGIVLGGSAGPRAKLPPQGEPRVAIERAVLPALRRPPCLVSFSGGRDSSAVLAVATRVARREGLPLPIPATNRIPGAPAADESRWQEKVIAYLGLSDWLKLSFTDELDAIGPYARRVLRRHGVVWPFNVHFHLPLLDLAVGGSLLTGIGGDELFGAVRRVPIRASSFAPRPLRAAVSTRRHPLEVPWLRAAAQRSASAALASEQASEPLRLLPRARWWLARRYMRIGIHNLGLVARDRDVSLSHPLADPSVWAATAQAGRPRGFADRGEALRRLLGGMLPEACLSRSDKASFDEAFWNRHSRAFARAWDGAGVPADVVDGDALRRHWTSSEPASQSFLLVQRAWLESERRSAAASAGDGVEKQSEGLSHRVPLARAAKLPAGHPAELQKNSGIRHGEA
jgi:asparagine synthetase B (glutamine-hydrolysing)